MCEIGVMTGYSLDSIRFELRCVSYCCDEWLQGEEYKVWTEVCVRMVWWRVTGWTVYDLNCGVCKIGVMIGCRLDSRVCEIWCVSDRFDDWLQAGKYKVWTALCARLVWYLASRWTVWGVISGACQIGLLTGYRLDSVSILNCRVCQIGVMTGCKMGSISFELQCVSYWFVDGLQTEPYKVWTVVCFRLVWWLATGLRVWGLNWGVCQIGVMTGYRLVSIRWEMWCVSDWCDDRLQTG